MPLPLSSAATENRLRWTIIALLFAATVLNYVDRQTLSILAPQVQRDLGITDVGYARIVQCFLIAYAFSYLASGWITDKLGAKVSLALFLGGWSLANMATAWVRNATQLGFARLTLGLGEPGVYTAGPKVVAEHFAPEQRAFGIGVYTAGAMVGATIAPPLIAYFALQYGWRAAFAITGAAGFLWVAIWLVLYRSPDGAQPPRTPEPIQWGSILLDRRIWGLAIARLIADPVWYFYLFWFPKYLMDQRGVGLREIASLGWIVYLAADIGSVGGGLLSGRLIRRGMAPARSRIVTMGCAAALAPLGMLIALHWGIGPTLALGALVACAHLIFQVNIGALVVDLYPLRSVATIFGFIATGSALGGFVSARLLGQLASHGAYDKIFLAMGILHPLAWLIAWGSLKRKQY